jgi:hypothetical protein
MKDVFLRAERAEDALMALVDEVMTPSAPGRTVVGITRDTPLHNAIVLLSKQGTLTNKERANHHLKKPIYPTAEE